MPTACETSDPSLNDVAQKIRAGFRLEREDGLALVRSDDLPALSQLATEVRFQKHPERSVTYIVDRNINPTNICTARCSFCAFDRLPGDPEGYVLTHEEMFRKMDELVEGGGVQVLLQGGHHPKLGVDYYEELFTALRRRHPQVRLHALSPSEICHIARLSRISIGAVLERLRAAGLGSIPGGGGEILVDRVRQQVAPRKASTDEWLGVMREAHRQGLPSSATMMYGHVETLEDRVEHLLRLRELQDETGGFTAFICWPFQPGGSELALPRSGSHEYLKMVATARLMLDNFDNLQTSFITQGRKVSQLALAFGCNDYGGTTMEENVVSAAGTRRLMPIDDIEASIRDAGFEPLRRDSDYGMLERRGGPDTETTELDLPTGGGPELVSGRPVGSWLESRERQIERRVSAGERLSEEDGVFLMRTPRLEWLGRLANQVRERRHGDVAFYVMNRHLNPSNYCVYSCKFCAFARQPGDAGGYRLSLERVREMARKLEPELREVHIVGGLDPTLPYEYYLEVLRILRAERPDVHLKAFTMIEIEWLSRIGRKPIPDVLDDLLDAGLGSCPGGGVEVLSTRVHRELFGEKLSPEFWLETARTVQQRGISMNATLLYGHMETPQERVRHMLRVRELQDETGGFLAFIPLAFHPANTQLAHLPGPSGFLDLRVLAVSRLLLDNIAHIKTYWIMHGIDVAQVALHYGADDLDGTVIEERITHDAGARTPLGVTRDELERTIHDAGRVPCERDTLYRRILV